MNYSTNYNLNKPERSEQFNIDHWNNNTDAIDTQMHINEVNIAQNATDIATLFTGLNTKNTSDTNSVFYKLMKLIYPVGSLYWSSKSTNPASLFGGTWVQIKDRFVLACGDTYKTVGATGGASTVTLYVGNMPSHSHLYKPSGTITMNAHSHGLNNHTHSFSGTTGEMSANATGDFQSVIRGVNVTATKLSKEAQNDLGDNSKTWTTGCFSKGNSMSSFGLNFWTPDHVGANSNPASIHIDVSHTHHYSGITGGNSGDTTPTTSTGSFTGAKDATYAVGSGTPFSILPPYVVKYCWERTA